MARVRSESMAVDPTYTPRIVTHFCRITAGRISTLAPSVPRVVPTTVTVPFDAATCRLTSSWPVTSTTWSAARPARVAPRPPNQDWTGS